MQYNITPIGSIETCFKEKFGIPKQAGLVKEARGIIRLQKPYNVKEAVQGLDYFSHIWVIFIFHKSPRDTWTPTVRPPRLGGNKRVGVFASRSPVRPNFIGQSIVKLDKIETKKGEVLIHVSGVDLLDGTPVIDIKPYLPYNDIIKNASWGWIDKTLHNQKSRIKVSFSKQAQDFLKNQKEEKHLRELIKQVIKNDPRPGYYSKNPKQERKTEFAERLYDFDIKWKLDGEKATIMEIVSLEL